MNIFSQKNFVFSPLEQFEDVTWVFFDVFFENAGITRNYIFEKEENLFQNFAGDVVDYAPYPGTWYLGGIILFSYYITVKGFAFDNFASINTVIKNIKEDLYKFIGSRTPILQTLGLFLLCLIALITIFSGFVVSLWFNHSFVATVAEGKVLLDTNFSSYTQDIIGYKQISFSISWDENLISILGGLFLIENDNDEEFILEEEESDFVEDVVAPLFIANLGKDVKENGGLFLKVCGIFSFVLINNLMGMLPYSDTGTSSLILTFWVAFSIFVSLIYMMIQKQGISHFFGLFMPSGCPLPLIFVLIPIEFISYSFRLVSLSVRLFANMMAGHTLLKVIVGFSWSMILMGDLFLIANLFPIAILFVLTFLELGVAIIQSYIFTILTCIYLKDIFVAH